MALPPYFCGVFTSANILVGVLALVHLGGFWTCGEKAGGRSLGLRVSSSPLHLELEDIFVSYFVCFLPMPFVFFGDRLIAFSIIACDACDDEGVTLSLSFDFFGDRLIAFSIIACDEGVTLSLSLALVAL